MGYDCNPQLHGEKSYTQKGYATSPGLVGELGFGPLCEPPSYLISFPFLGPAGNCTPIINDPPRRKWEVQR